MSSDFQVALECGGTAEMARAFFDNQAHAFKRREPRVAPSDTNSRHRMDCRESGAASWVVCPLVVIARSEATKQSIYPRVKDWIASLRSQ
jgi:hypothetical protein